MRIGTRLWIATVAVVTAVVVCLAALRVEADQSALLAATLEDRRFFGRSLQSALASVPEEDVHRAASGLLNDPELARGHIDVALGGEPTAAALAASLGTDESARFARGEVACGPRDDQLITLIPLGPERVLELREPRLVHASVARAALWGAVWASLGIAALTWLVTWLLTRSLVTRPLTRLGELARRLGDGDLSVRSDARGTDEISAFARELDRAAEHLRDARTALDRASLERTNLLHSLRHADRLRTVGALAAAIAHELGTPLATVRGYAQLIEASRAASEDDKRGARVIGEQTARMSKLIRGLLDFGRTRSEQRPEDVRDVVSAALDLLEPLARKRGITLDVRLPEERTMVRADRSALVQVLTNLIANAFDVTESGGKVELDIHVDRDVCVIDVKDRGPGIAEGTEETVFEPFFTTKPAGEGTGLGLSVARGIVADHRGQISARNRDGGGAVLEVRLPSVTA